MKQAQTINPHGVQQVTQKPGAKNAPRHTRQRKQTNVTDPHNEGELWLVSYADLMTLLLGFFIILFSMSSLDEKKFSDVSNAVSSALGKKENPKTNILERDMNPIKQQEYDQIMYLISKLNMGSLADLAGSAGDAKQVERIKSRISDIIGPVSPKPDRILELVIPDRLLFPAGSTTITDDARQSILLIAEKIKATKNLARVLVVGHTDSSPLSTTTSGLYKDNRGLSAARASAVASVLERYGIKPNIIEVIGRGSNEPLFAERDASGKLIPENLERNRRVHIILQSK